MNEQPKKVVKNWFCLNKTRLKKKKTYICQNGNETMKMEVQQAVILSDMVGCCGYMHTPLQYYYEHAGTWIIIMHKKIQQHLSGRLSR